MSYRNTLNELKDYFNSLTGLACLFLKALMAMFRCLVLSDVVFCGLHIHICSSAQRGVILKGLWKVWCFLAEGILFFLFISPTSQQSGILNPRIWLTNRARSSGLDFPIWTPSTDRSAKFQLWQLFNLLQTKTVKHSSESNNSANSTSRFLCPKCQTHSYGKFELKCFN